MNDKKQTLADIIAAQRAALWEIDEAGGDVSPDIEAQLDAIDIALAEKVDRILLFAQEATAQADVHRRRAETQLSEAKRLARLGERLREYVRISLASAGIDRLPTESFPRLSLRKGRPHVEVDEAAFIPWAAEKGMNLLRFKEPEPDKTEIAARLKAGEQIPGCAIIDGKPSLSGHK